MHRLALTTIILLILLCSQQSLSKSKCFGDSKKPNIIYIMADDLGWGELGCYGQTKIKTPCIDAMAKEGMKFTQMYSGHCVCAPSRCTLMTGLHTGHCYVRGNKGSPVFGQLPIPDETLTLAELFKEQGYNTGCVGKWGLGGIRTDGVPRKQGFDFFFGYLDQWNAHNHYPAHLWMNDRTILLQGNLYNEQKVFSHDLLTEESLKFIKKQKVNKPFFLYIPYAVPHVSIQVPEDSLAEYKGKFEETPFPGAHYQGHPTPRAAYAAMVTRMDRDVGRIIELIKTKGMDENTLIIFTSDNGPTFNGGTDSTFFNSAGPFRGLKTMLYEGGIRIPFVARWPGKLPKGSTSEEVGAFWDMLPTFMTLIGGRIPEGLDGKPIVSLTDTDKYFGEDGKRISKNTMPIRTLYWEQPNSKISKQAIRHGDWKGYIPNVSQGKAALQLYNLKDDEGEKNNVAAKNPEVATEIYDLMQKLHTPSEHFPFPQEQ